MTAGTAEKVFRLRDKRLKPAAALVLIHLAYRAHYEDGRYAWPSLDSIAQACFISRASVARGLEQLKELGYVRVSPNQRWNEYDAETGEWRRKSYRTTPSWIWIRSGRWVRGLNLRRLILRPLRMPGVSICTVYRLNLRHK